MIHAAFPWPLWKDDPRGPVGCLPELSLRQLPVRSYRRQPAPVVRISLIFFQLFKPVQRLLDSRQISSRQLDLHQADVSRQEQIAVLPGCSILNDPSQPTSRFLQAVPLVQDLYLDDLKVAFEQRIARHLLDQVRGD